MPYAIKRLKSGLYKVINKETGKIHSKHTTKANAIKQIHLLSGIDHGWVPTGKGFMHPMYT